MNDEMYRLNIGDFQCTVVSDGYISVPTSLPGSGGASGSRPDHEIMDISCLVVRTQGENVLIDCGCGSGFQDSAGKLAQNLDKAGINRHEISTIVFTHGHEDHVGGVFDREGKPAYPNARYAVSRKEWECWEMKPETPMNEGLFASARKHLLGIRDRFDLLEDNAEVVPGITLLPARGHTLGGVIIRIASGEDTLLCIGDLIHSQREFTRPDLYSFLDSDPEAAMKLRTDGLAEIGKSGALVYACHFPFPGIGTFVKNEETLGWQPIQTN